MAIEIVTGYQGKQHVTANDIGGFQQGVVGTGDYVLNVGKKAEATLISNNSVRINDGELVMQGVHWRIKPNTYENVTINNGARGQKRKDAIVARYAKNSSSGIEKIELAVLQGTATTGTPVAPTPTEGDIRTGTLKHEMLLYIVELNGLNVVSVEPAFDVLMNMSMINERLSDTSYEIIRTSNGYVKKYKNGWFESFIQTITNNSDFAWNQIGTTGLYYAKFTNFGFGITATKILNMQMSVSNNGVIWGACPSLSASNSAIDGLVVQFGRDTTRNTTIHAYVVGHWK
jgi:hypothetical protein|nr:MAG TPA: hypothetical protein [Caudoviricetes sp.]